MDHSHSPLSPSSPSSSSSNRRPLPFPPSANSTPASPQRQQQQQQQPSELASWVNQVRQRNQSYTSSTFAASNSPLRSQATSATSPTASHLPAAISSASELEQDFQRQRQERQNRRSRLSTSGVRGIPDSPLASPSTELPPSSPSPLLATTGIHGAMIGGPGAQQQQQQQKQQQQQQQQQKQQQQQQQQQKQQQQQQQQQQQSAPVSSSTSPMSPTLGASNPSSPHVRRANSLLSRYGGQYGPTGIAAGPKSGSDAPVSLANFMGGKASGPRLGKLAGDGKSAPPEAAEIHESRWVALPGLATGERPGGSAGARPLASFLEDRANAAGARRTSVPVFPKGSGGAAQEASAPSSPSPAKYSSFLSRSRSNSYRTDRDDLMAAPPSPSIGLSSSPRKAYMDLIQKQNAESAAAIQRPPSPAKPWEKPQPMASPDEVARPRSPFKSTSSFVPSSPVKASSGVQIPGSAGRLSAQPESAYTSPRKDAATSPLKPEDVPFAKTVTTSFAAAETPSASDRAAPSWRSSTLPAGRNEIAQPSSPHPDSSQRSSTLPQTPLSPSGSDRNPTASLTRLSAKKMVGQRIREAQERDSQAQKESDSATASSGVGAGLSRYGGSAYGSGGVRDRWPAGATHAGSNVSTPSHEDSKRLGGWSPSKIGNALPGLAGRSPPKSAAGVGAAGVLGTSPSKRYAEDEADSRAAPVRLPGMGAESSPFKRFGAAPPSPTKDDRIDDAKDGDVLQSLTKGRVRGPVRRSGAPAAASAQSTTVAAPSAPLHVATSAAPSGATLGAPSSPKKVTSGFSTPSSPSKLHALAEKYGGSTAFAQPSSPTKGSFATSGAPRSPVKTVFSSTAPSSSSTEAKPAAAPAPTKPPRSTRGKRIHVLISGSGSNLQSLIDATLLNPPAGIPVIPDAQISFVLSNRKAAYGLTRASESNPPIPTKVLALKTWQNRNPGGTREEYDRVLARAVLDGPAEEGKGTPPDLIVLAGFMHIVSEGFLHALGHKTSLPSSTPTIGTRPSKAVPIINLHPALPGAFDGANAIPRAFEAYKQGLTDRTGCMVHEVVADVDRGRPLIVREIVIQRGWDLAKLEEEIHKVEHVIIVEGARQVLEGRLEELDREEAAKERARARQEAAQQQHRRSLSPRKAVPAVNPHEVVHVESTEGGANVAFKAEQAFKASSFEPSAVLNYGVASAPRGSNTVKTVSVDAVSILADGSTKPINAAPTSPGGIINVQALYEDETLAIVHRFKAASGLMENKVWIRIGMRSPIHPAQEELHATESADEVVKRAEELAKRYGVKPTFVPSGFEDSELVSSLGGSWAVIRQGSRARFDVTGTSLYRVRKAVAASAGGADKVTVTQVDLKTGNFCSGDSFVASILGSSLVWHGRGSDDTTRDAARRFSKALQLESTGKVGASISENEEGREDAFFWDLFDRSESYASAWYHRLPQAAATPSAVQLFDLGIERGVLTLHPAIDADCFGQMDLVSPQRQGEVSLLNLGNRELYVVVGRRARNQRVKILAACKLAERLADHLQSGPGRESGRPATHVLVLPSRVPREIRAASRYWSDAIDDRSNRMNVKTTREAAKEVVVDAWPRLRLLDPTWLPVGVSEDDLGEVV